MMAKEITFNLRFNTFCAHLWARRIVITPLNLKVDVNGRGNFQTLKKWTEKSGIHQQQFHLCDSPAFVRPAGLSGGLLLNSTWGGGPSAYWTENLIITRPWLINYPAHVSRITAPGLHIEGGWVSRQSRSQTTLRHTRKAPARSPRSRPGTDNSETATTQSQFHQIHRWLTISGTCRRSQ